MLTLDDDAGFPIRLVVPGQIGGRSVVGSESLAVSDQVY